MDAPASEPFVKPRAPALYGIIVFKWIKGLLRAAGCGAYALWDSNLPEELRPLAAWVHLDPDSPFFTALALQPGKITLTNVLWVVAGTFVNALVSFVQATGLMLRALGRVPGDRRGSVLCPV